jgi:hypothetical protein
VSLFLTIGLATALGAVTGRFVSHLRLKRAARLERKHDAPAHLEDATEERAQILPPLEGFACALGDVLVYEDGSEAWLSGMSVFGEVSPSGRIDTPSLVLFSSADSEAWVLASAAPEGSLSRCKRITLAISMEPPFVVEHAGKTYERTSRLPLAASSFGENHPGCTGTHVVSRFRSADGSELVSFVWERAHVFEATRLDAGTYDRLPGKLTLL